MRTFAFILAGAALFGAGFGLAFATFAWDGQEEAPVEAQAEAVPERPRVVLLVEESPPPAPEEEPPAAEAPQEGEPGDGGQGGEGCSGTTLQVAGDGCGSGEDGEGGE